MTTASVKERKEIFAELRQCIKGRGESFDSIFYTFLSFIRCIAESEISSNIPFRITRTSYQRFMQALLPHPTQIQVGVYWKYVTYSMTDAKDMDFKMKTQFRCSKTEACVCSSGMLHHAESPSLLLASWLRCSLKS